MTMTDVKEPSVREVLELPTATGTLLSSAAAATPAQEQEEETGTMMMTGVTSSLSHAESQTDFRTDVLRLVRGGDYEVRY